MAWLKTHLKSQWRWTGFNLLALSVLLIVLTQGSTDWNDSNTFHPMLESGKWGIRFLLICLTMTPLHTFLRWSSALKLRKSAGLWAFGFGLLHMLQYAIETWESNRAWQVNGTPWHWLTWPMQLYIALGVLGLTILTALAVTSNKWSMRRLGKNWKRLHRLVYVASMTLVVHALLASTMSKKMMVRDPEAISELRVYLGALIVLLVVRIPQVRTLLLQMVARLRPQARTVESVAPRIIPNRTAPQWPNLRASNRLLSPEDSADFADLEVRSQPVEEVENLQMATALPHISHKSTTKSKSRVLAS